jgi:hypothetical protein
MSKGNHPSKLTKGLKGRKEHGPKRHLFNDYKPLEWNLGQLGLLSKYHNFESFKLACMARGCKNPTKEMWTTFVKLGTKTEQDNFLDGIRKNKPAKKPIETKAVKTDASVA